MATAKKVSQNKLPTRAKAVTAGTNAKLSKRPITNQLELDAENPIPFEHTGRSFSFVNNSQYIPFLGANDSFAQQLLEARLLSTTHNACVTTKTDYIAGDGFHNITNEGSEPVEIPGDVQDWFDNVNINDDDVTEINKQILESHFTFGNTPIELVRIKLFGEYRFYVYAHSFLEWRKCKPNKNGIITHAIQSKLFLKDVYITPEDLKNAKKLPLYSSRNTDRQNWQPDGNGGERSLIWYKNSITGFPHYGLPEAVACMIFQILEYKGDIINSHTGDGKRGRVMVVASEEGIEGSDIHNFSTQKEGSYNEADDKWTQKIILANKWDAMLAGIISPSTLGKGSGFLTKIHEIKQLTVINPAQRHLLKNVWKHIFKEAEAWTKLPFTKFKWDIKNSIDISGLTDVDITPAVQVNEVRKAKGLPEDPTKKGVYMSEMKAKQEAEGEKEGNEEETGSKKKKPAAKTKKEEDV